ncbi:Prefoldin [Pseudocohnilembus persalinus]|uniref:Prefoldin n=1 Tax=Pseudocohnilembus persalinus TaxID=266149 RepID=A0A0V0Q8Z8_PSEPJ|nr:Prefoldin [Pseudocohnilembus persalinus]|eukprot:KRW98722.1 Prefoldin [Pseudocohnilembus persalinus]
MSEIENLSPEDQYKKYSEFLDTKLKLDKFKLEEKLIQIKLKINDYESVIDYINAQAIAQKLNLQSDKNEQKSQQQLLQQVQKQPKINIDIGSQFYMKAKVIEPQKIILDVGLNCFVELTFQEALPIIKKNIQNLNIKKKQYISDMAHVDANIKAFEATLDQLQQENLKQTQAQQIQQQFKR